MSIRHDSPAWFRRIRDEGGPVAQGRAVPLREVGTFAGYRIVEDATVPADSFRVVAGGNPTAQPPQAAVAPPAAPETACKPRTVTVASGAGYIACSCGWRSRVSDDGYMFMPGYYSPADQERDWEAHAAERKAQQPQDPIVARVCALLLSRSAVGIAKYGTTLADNPASLREWLTHMRDEMLDGALYAQRAIAELDAKENQP